MDVHDLINHRFAHIERSMQLGLVHLSEPRVIFWYGTGFNNHHLEWIDHPTINEAADILLDFELKTIQLGNEGTEGFPYLDYFEYMEMVVKGIL